MLKRRLGKTGLTVSIIGFGGIKLPLVDRKTAYETLNRALDLGINFVDTVRGYGDSEEKIGWAIGGRRKEFHISTKSLARTFSEMEDDIETSLRNLRTGYIDLYLCRNLLLQSARDGYDEILMLEPHVDPKNLYNFYKHSLAYLAGLSALIRHEMNTSKRNF